MVTSMPTMKTPLATLLANEMRDRGWSQRAMADAAGLKNHVAVGNILRGKTKMPDLETLGKLARGLATDAVSAATYFGMLIRAAGYSIEDHERADEIFARFESVLTPRQLERFAAIPPEQFATAVNLILNLIETAPAQDDPE